MSRIVRASSPASILSSVRGSGRAHGRRVSFRGHEWRRRNQGKGGCHAVQEGRGATSREPAGGTRDVCAPGKRGNRDQRSPPGRHGSWPAPRPSDEDPQHLTEDEGPIGWNRVTTGPELRSGRPAARRGLRDVDHRHPFLLVIPTVKPFDARDVDLVRTKKIRYVNRRRFV